jgi:hypothetical protein
MNRRGRPFKRESGVARKTRINEVLKALKDGTSDRADLAAKYNVSLSQISKDVAEAMQMIERSMLDSAEKYRALQVARHEDYYEAVTEEFNNARDASAPAAVVSLLANTALKVLDQENKLLSLYTQKFEVEQRTTHRIEMPVDKAAEMLAQIEAMGFLNPPPPPPPAESTAPATIDGSYREVTEDAPSEASAAARP